MRCPELSGISVLRRLDLNIQKIGVNLGVEGVEAPQTSAGQTLWHATVGGDVVGRDNTTNIGTKIQKLMGPKQTGPSIKLKSTLRLESHDAAFIEQVVKQQRNSQGSQLEVITAYLEREEFNDPIRQHILDLASRRCRVLSASVDPTDKGFVIMFDFERAI